MLWFSSSRQVSMKAGCSRNARIVVSPCANHTILSTWCAVHEACKLLTGPVMRALW